MKALKGPLELGIFLKPYTLINSSFTLLLLDAVSKHNTLPVSQVGWNSQSMFTLILTWRF